MIQSPCRHCPNREMDKNICALTCPLLHRLQRFEACRHTPNAWVAIDLEDSDRYHLTVEFNDLSSELSALSI